MTARVIRAAATAAGVAAILAYAVADALSAIDRALSTYGVETPTYIPDWVDDGTARWDR